MKKLVGLLGNFYCFKCGKSVINLYRHLKQDHNISIDEYLEWIYNGKKLYRSKKFKRKEK